MKFSRGFFLPSCLTNPPRLNFPEETSGKRFHPPPHFVLHSLPEMDSPFPCASFPVRAISSRVLVFSSHLRQEVVFSVTLHGDLSSMELPPRSFLSYGLSASPLFQHEIFFFFFRVLFFFPFYLVPLFQNLFLAPVGGGWKFFFEKKNLFSFFFSLERSVSMSSPFPHTFARRAGDQPTFFKEESPPMTED